MADLLPAEVVSALTPVLGQERCTRIDAVADSRLGSIAVVLEDLRDPHNTAAALRSCESMGVLSVHVIQKRQRFRTSPRVTQGCHKWLDIARESDAPSCIAALQRRGIKVYGAVPGGAHSLEALTHIAPIALAFGNEHTGLSPELRERIDDEFSIPMHGFSQSLNVSVSVAIALYTITEAHRQRLGRPGDLIEERLLALRARYYAQAVRGAGAIVERWRLQASRATV